MVVVHMAHERHSMFTKRRQSTGWLCGKKDKWSHCISGKAHCATAQLLHVWQDDLSGADIKAMCTEAGLLALRERRMRVTHTDFKKAKEKVLYKKKEGVPEGLYL